jgi:general secretion pathway protein L
MAMRIWGVDLGAHSVKLCSLLSSFRSFTVESVASARVEAGGETPLLAAQKLALASLLEAPHAKPDAVILSLPGAAAATHVISLPSVDAKRLEQTLGFEVESLIPFDLTDVAYDHVSLGQSDGKSHLLVGVVRKGAFKDVLAAMDELGLDPRTVTLGQVAYQSLFPTLAPPLENLEAILDLGHERCCIAFREEGKLVFGRSFDGGGASLTRAIARDLSLTFAEAERVKEQRGSLLEGADAALVVPLAHALQPILREIRQTLKLVAGRSRRPLERLWITGGTSLLPGLAELLAREFETSVQPLPLDPPGGEVLTKVTPSESLALAAALGGHFRRSRFNLRRGDQSFQGDFAKLRGKLGKLAALAAVLLVMAGVRAYAQVYILGQREKSLDDAVCASTKGVLGKCIRDINVARSSLMGGAASGTTIPHVSALDLLTETTTHLNVEGAKVTELDIGTDQVRIHGEADSFETVDKVVAALKTYRCFQDIQRGRVQRGKEASVEFNLEARNACAAEPGGGS